MYEIKLRSILHCDSSSACWELPLIESMTSSPNPSELLHLHSCPLSFLCTQAAKWFGWIQWSIYFLYIYREPAQVKYGADSLYCKCMSPILSGTGEYQWPNYISLVDLFPVYLPIFLLFIPWNFHPLMRLSVSAFASYGREKIASWKKLFFLILSLLCVLS